MDLIKWLKDIGVIPAQVSRLNSPKVDRPITREKIPAGFLAEMAYEWESYGGGATPQQFVQAIGHRL